MTKQIKDNELNDIAGGTQGLAEAPPTGPEVVDQPSPIDSDAGGGSHPSPTGPKRV